MPLKLVSRFVAVLVLLGCLAVLAHGAEPSQVKRRPPWTTSRLVGSPEPPAPYKIVPAYPNIRFDKPTSIEEIPGANRWLVTERDGNIFTLRQDAGAARADLAGNLRELPAVAAAGGAVSLFDAELHPKFRENRFLFVCYVHPGEGRHTRVSRFTLSADAAPRIDPDSERVVIRWPAGGHNAGCLEFGVDGFLYIATGDGSGPNPPDSRGTGQDVSDLLGSILRIDVDRQRDGRTYAIPADNPFVKLAGARPEIWAYGLRNPWKFGVDPRTGDIYAADNGWETWEMIHRIVRGGNCGWSVMEGRAALRSELKRGPTPVIPPIKDHSHTEANSVIGGPVYRGDKLPNLAGSFVYGDYITGTIWAVRPEEDDTYAHSTLVDTDQRIVAFTQGTNGGLYVLDYDLTGQIYEIVPSGRRDTSATFPRRLSETGLFTSLEHMTPAPGVVPYAVRVERWLDGAKAERFVAVPGQQRIRLAVGDTPAVYPEGTVLVSHLTEPQGHGLPPLRLETQILHFEDGQWSPYSYLWDDTLGDATLVESSGGQRAMHAADPANQDGSGERMWHINASNECRLCHNAGSRFVLGFVANQLRGPFADGGDPLARLVAQGVLENASAPGANDPSRLVDPHDTSNDLNDRARSYLHVNCSMCHHPGGNAIVSFYLRRDLPFDKLNTNKGTGIGTFGLRDAKIIVPGDPYRSILLYRMSKLGYARMPYIGSKSVDSAGVALIEAWIRSLPAGEAQKRSPPATAGSAEAQALRMLLDAGNAAPAARETAIRTLAATSEGALALVAKMHAAALSKADIKTAVALGAKATRGDIRGLFEGFLPESQRRATLGSRINPETILSRQGDQQRGKLIFYSDGARCRACHDISDRGKSLGPTLKDINKKYPRAADVLQHVLQPSLKIDEPFAAYVVVTDDGRVFSGLRVQQDEQEITIQTTEKKRIRIARQNIDEMRKSSKSLMPDLILSDLTAQEAADLFEYIRSRGPAK